MASFLGEVRQWKKFSSTTVAKEHELFPWKRNDFVTKHAMLPWKRNGWQWTEGRRRDRAGTFREDHIRMHMSLYTRRGAGAA